jgi:hypothetical protein
LEAGGLTGGFDAGCGVAGREGGGEGSPALKSLGWAGSSRWKLACSAKKPSKGCSCVYHSDHSLSLMAAELLVIADL